MSRRNDPLLLSVPLLARPAVARRSLMRAELQKPSATDGDDGAITHSLGELSTSDRYCGGFAKSNPSSHHWAISLEESPCT
jgi:hypothetical protein